MTRILKAIRRFFLAEDGPTAVEYAVMLVLIIAVCITAIRTIGEPTQSSFQRFSDEYDSVAGPSGGGGGSP